MHARELLRMIGISSCHIPCAMGPGMLARGGVGMKKGQTYRHHTKEMGSGGPL